MRALFLVLLVLLAQTILADDTYPFKSTHYGCPDECSTEEDPKCEISIPSNKFFVALHPNYFEHKVNGKFRYCEHYYVGMMIDKEKNSGKYKMVRGKVVDQCGSCAETQVDLSQPMFETLAKKSTGVIPMLFVILDKDTSEIIDGPHYNSESLKKFSSQTGISREDIMESFKQAAKNMNENGEKGLSEYPWESGKATSKKTTTTTKKTTTTTKKTTTTTTKKTTTTTTKKTTTTTTKKTTTTTSKKTTTTSTKKTTTTTSKKTTTTSTVETTSVAKTVSKTEQTAEPTAEPTVVEIPTEKEPIEPVPISQDEAHVPEHIDEPEQPETPAKEPEQPETPAKKPEQPKTPAKKPENELDDFDKANGGTNAPVTATIITCSTLGAAGVGLLMLKRKSPQKYDDLKKKFPEAFGTVKRSLTRGASTIKRGVSRSVSRRGSNKRPTQVPTSYSFTLNNEDGLPRVSIYDDPCPTKTRGAQHW